MTLFIDELPPEIAPIHQKIGEFLNIIIYRSDFIFINIWSGVHFLAGALLILILSLFQKGFKRFGWLFFLLLIWEGFEYVMYHLIKSPLWIPELWYDTAGDIVIGMLGGILMAILLAIIKHKSQPQIVQ